MRDRESRALRRTRAFAGWTMVAGMAAVACTDLPSEVRATLGLDDPALVTAQVDDVALSIDIASGTFTVGNELSVQVDGEAAATLAAGLDVIRRLDENHAALAEAAPPPTGGGECGPQGEGCAQDAAPGARTIPSRRSTGSGRVRVRLNPGAAERGGPRREATNAKSPARPVAAETVPAGPVIAADYGSGPCLDIAESIYFARQADLTLQRAFGGIAADYGRAVRDILIEAAENADPTALAGLIQESKRLLRELVLAEVELYRAQASLQILSGLYSAHNCWFGEWSGATTLSPFTPGGGFGGGGGGYFSYSCSNEVWQYSVDGGITWHNITLETCVFEWVNAS